MSMYRKLKLRQDTQAGYSIADCERDIRPEPIGSAVDMRPQRELGRTLKPNEAQSRSALVEGNRVDFGFWDE